MFRSTYLYPGGAGGYTCLSPPPLPKILPKGSPRPPPPTDGPDMASSCLSQTLTVDSEHELGVFVLICLSIWIDDASLCRRIEWQVLRTLASTSDCSQSSGI